MNFFKPRIFFRINIAWQIGVQNIDIYFLHMSMAVEIFFFCFSRNWNIKIISNKMKHKKNIWDLAFVAWFMLFWFVLEINIFDNIMNLIVKLAYHVTMPHTQNFCLFIYLYTYWMKGMKGEYNQKSKIKKINLYFVYFWKNTHLWKASRIGIR